MQERCVYIHIYSVYIHYKYYMQLHIVVFLISKYTCRFFLFAKQHKIEAQNVISEI